MISVVINTDTRVGFDQPSISVGEFENGQPNGARSIDFLTEGIKNKMNFLRGQEAQCILYIDEHLPIPDGLFMDIVDLVHSYGNNSQVICHPNNRTIYRWNDHIYINALKLAEGDYVVHFDGDGNAFRSDESNIIEQYFDWLNNGYKYICQPIHPLQTEKWYHASTQFFICKRETLDFKEIEMNLYSSSVNGKYVACLEHLLGALAGDGTVLYPPRNLDEYMIFCWRKYESGLLKKLNEMPYQEVKDFILKCGLTSTSW